MKKHYFLLWTKETAFFPYFYHGIIFYSAELFDCAVNFKFYLNICIFKHKHKSNIKGAIFELRSSHLFRDQPYKEVLEVKCQACSFTGVLSFKSVFEQLCSQRIWGWGWFLRILVTFFRLVFSRISHNLICNNFAILENKMLTKI